MQFVHPHAPPPFEATAIAGILLGSSGVCNVILFAWTRPVLLPLGTDDEDEEKPHALAQLDHEDDLGAALPELRGMARLGNASLGSQDGVHYESLQPSGALPQIW